MKTEMVSYCFIFVCREYHMLLYEERSDYYEKSVLCLRSVKGERLF